MSKRNDEGINPVRPTIKVTEIKYGTTYSTSVRGVNGVMLPNNLKKEDYDKLMKEKSGEVVTYNIKDRENAVLENTFVY